MSIVVFQVRCVLEMRELNVRVVLVCMYVCMCNAESKPEHNAIRLDRRIELICVLVALHVSDHTEENLNADMITIDSISSHESHRARKVSPRPANPLGIFILHFFFHFTRDY